MLIRRNGAKEGIKEYLEHGQKKDRHYSRDQMDDRVILVGDLNALDNIITNVMDNSGERYAHITLGFKEDHVPSETLSAIANEFREFYFKAYNDEEIYFYAEAHLPRIKSYRSKSENEIIERKPHIHVVVPKINMLTGQGIDFKETVYTDYVDAFQEYINCKYGLESPKDSPRYKQNENSEYISRYKGDAFIGKGKDFKAQILEQIIDKNIQSLAELENLLRESNYSFKYRNANKSLDQRYLNVETEDGNFNLRDHVFKSEFLSLSKSDKLKSIQDSLNNRTVERNNYVDIGTARPIEDKYLKILEEWQSKALEAKYIHRADKTQREAFYKLNDEDKVIHLRQLDDKFYARHQNNLDELMTNNLDEVMNEYRIDVERAIINNFDAAARSARGAADYIERIRRTESGYISAIQRERIAKRYADLINSRRGGEAGHRDGNNAVTTTKRQDPKRNLVDEVYDQVGRNPDNFASGKYTRTELKELYARFNEELKADVLLELLEKTHGINPELYRITVSNGGYDRIGCGNRNLSNLDFCTNELRLNLSEAIELLKNALGMQAEIYREQGWRLKDKSYLYQEYREWLKGYQKERLAFIQQNKDDHKLLKEELKNKYKLKRDELWADKSIPYHKRAEMLSALKVERLIDEEALKKRLSHNARQIREEYNSDMQDSYRKFLIKMAMEGDERALLELRRLRINYDFTMVTSSLSFQYVERYNEFKLPFKYEVDKDGVIHYKINEHTVIKDHGKRVEVTKSKEEYIDLTLKLARQKFGDNLELRGNVKFKATAIELAMRRGYKIKYLDEFSRNYHKKLVDELQVKSKIIESIRVELLEKMPSRLIVSEIYQDGILVHGKLEKVNLVEVKDDHGNAYQLSGYQINHAAKKLEVGQLVEVKFTNNELNLKLANEQKVRNQLKREIIAENASTFSAAIKNKYSIENPALEYHGVLIKTGITKSQGWVLVKTNDGKFVRLQNQDLYDRIKAVDVKPGAPIAVISPKKETAQVEYQVKEQTLTKQQQPLFAELLKQAEECPSSNKTLGPVVSIDELTFKNGTTGYRMVVNDVLSGKVTTHYSSSKFENVSIGDYTLVAKSGWSKYQVINFNQKIAEIYKAVPNSDMVVGDLLRVGYTTLRGKHVFTAEICTVDGPVRKYGEKLKAELATQGVKVGDCIEIRVNMVNKSKPVEKSIIEICELAKGIDSKIDKKMEQLKSNIKEEQQL